MASERDTCKIKITMVDTVTLALTLKSVRDQKTKELRAKISKVSASKMRELTFARRNACYLYSIVWIAFSCIE